MQTVKSISLNDMSALFTGVKQDLPFSCRTTRTFVVNCVPYMCRLNRKHKCRVTFFTPSPQGGAKQPEHQVPWRQRFRHPTRNKGMGSLGWFAQILPLNVYIFISALDRHKSLSSFQTSILTHYLTHYLYPPLPCHFLPSAASKINTYLLSIVTHLLSIDPIFPPVYFPIMPSIFPKLPHSAFPSHRTLRLIVGWTSSNATIFPFQCTQIWPFITMYTCAYLSLTYAHSSNVNLALQIFDDQGTH